MKPTDINLGNSPILASLMLSSYAQGNFVADKVFPMLPAEARNLQLPQMGDAAMRLYDTRRAPGASTKQIRISFQGRIFKVDQHSVEVPIPEEVFEEMGFAKPDTTRPLDVRLYLPIAEIAAATASAVLQLSYEVEAATLASTAANYAAGNTLALAAGTKWNAATGTPAVDIEAAHNVIRKKTGRRANLLTLSPDAYSAARMNPQVRSYFGGGQTVYGPATDAQLAQVFGVQQVVVGEAIYIDDADAANDAWGNNAVLSYSPPITSGATLNLGEPRFGYTHVLPGHPKVEVPFFDKVTTRSWIFRATFERKPHVIHSGAGFLFQNPA